MGQRGPIPLKSADRAIGGNVAGRPMTDSARAPGRILPAPEWMPREMADVWRETVRHAPKNLLARIDAGILTTYVVSRYSYESIATICAGKVWELARHADVLAKHQASMLKASTALGLDPSARARLRVESEMPASPATAAATLFDQLKEA